MCAPAAAAYAAAPLRPNVQKAQAPRCRNRVRRGGAADAAGGSEAGGGRQTCAAKLASAVLAGEGRGRGGQGCYEHGYEHAASLPSALQGAVGGHSFPSHHTNPTHPHQQPQAACNRCTQYGMKHSNGIALLQAAALILGYYLALLAACGAAGCAATSSFPPFPSPSAALVVAWPWCWPPPP